MILPRLQPGQRVAWGYPVQTGTVLCDHGDDVQVGADGRGADLVVRWRLMRLGPVDRATEIGAEDQERPYVTTADVPVLVGEEWR